MLGSGLLIASAMVLSGSAAPDAQDSAMPAKLVPWMAAQRWERDVDGPVVELGPAGAFDDIHIFAPCVAFEEGRYRLWYCGSTGSVARRVFRLGLATSEDGRTFRKAGGGAIYEFPGGKRSVLTPTLLRSAGGAVLREEGRLRMWFSSADLGEADGLHTLHETSSTDGLLWSEPSEALLENVYAPTILKEGPRFRMWYSDVSADPWVVRYAESTDGRRWKVRQQPVLRIDQDWERGRLFYPTVVKSGGVYLIWYGSYWSEEPQKTALGFAASLDGWRWVKNPHNPVLRPDPRRAWESHYTTSQSVVREADGSWRIWYASRKAPPFVNKYFAIGTARWTGIPSVAPTAIRRLDPERLASAPDRRRFAAWQQETRGELRRMLGIPNERIPLEPESRGRIELGPIVIEKWIYSSERGSRVPAVLYRPREFSGRLPAVVLTFGHGGSKSRSAYNYLGQLYARMGIACLAADPVGEEERHRTAGRGTRAHDPYAVHRRAWDAGRPIMGKLVFDTMRGIDFLLSREDVDPGRIGVAGNSLGGAKAGWMATLDDRLRFAVVSGWAFDEVALWSKYCTGAPNHEMRKRLTWEEYLSLAAPHCAVLVMNGDADVVIDRAGTGAAWEGTRRAVAAAAGVYEALGNPGAIRCWFEPGGGHRPYPAHKAGLDWVVRHARPDGWTPDRVKALKEVNFGRWAESHGIVFEKLYGTPLHLGGATVADMNIKPIAAEEMAVLKPAEVGRAEFTLEGWLDRVAPKITD